MLIVKVHPSKIIFYLIDIRKRDTSLNVTLTYIFIGSINGSKYKLSLKVKLMSRLDITKYKNKNMETKENTKLEIDIAQYSQEGKEVPKGHHYIIIVDHARYRVEQECMTGREILLLAGKTPPERFQLNQRFKHGKIVPIKYDQKVCFTEPGIEKFMTIPLDQTEGGAK